MLFDTLPAPESLWDRVVHARRGLEFTSRTMTLRRALSLVFQGARQFHFPLNLVVSRAISLPVSQKIRSLAGSGGPESSMPILLAVPRRPDDRRQPANITNFSAG